MKERKKENKTKNTVHVIDTLPKLKILANADREARKKCQKMEIRWPHPHQGGSKPSL